jgi:hypothetical protein
VADADELAHGGAGHPLGGDDWREKQSWLKSHCSLFKTYLSFSKR